MRIHEFTFRVTDTKQGVTVPITVECGSDERNAKIIAECEFEARYGKPVGKLVSTLVNVAPKDK